MIQNAVKRFHPLNAHSHYEQKMNSHERKMSSHERRMNNHEHKIAEIVVTENSCAALLIPVIAAFSQYDKRWLTWITDRVPSKGQLLAYGVNLQALRLIYVNSDRDSRWLTWEALAQGNSHTVITKLNKLTSKEICALEIAAAQGGAQGIIVRQR